MSTFSTQIPILSNLNAMNTSFQTHLMGVIAHHTKETTFYVSTPNVSKGASYTIHCIHAEIKRQIDAGRPLPQKMYLQIDGASDNTAKAVIASLEHLVVEGLCKVIEVWRLPVGHTHEDIDSRFGVIQQHIREQSLYTFRDFLLAVHAAFNYEPTVSVVPVLAIYDYKEFYDQFIDRYIRIYKVRYNTHYHSLYLSL